MYESVFLRRFGLALILSHVGLLVLLLALFLGGGFTIEEMTTTAALVGPVFVGFTAPVMIYIDESRHLSGRGKRINVSSVIATAAFPAALVALTAVAMILKATNLSFENFESFKLTLGVLESAFAGVVGASLRRRFFSENAPQ